MNTISVGHDAESVIINGSVYSVQEIVSSVRALEFTIKPGYTVHRVAPYSDSYIFSRVNFKQGCLIGLQDGNRWQDAVESAFLSISSTEFIEKFANDNSFRGAIVKNRAGVVVGTL